MVTDIKWSGLTGTIEGSTCNGRLILNVDESLFWHACITPEPGSQVSKIFEVGKLEQAYEWCVNQLKGDEQESKERGNLESQTV